MRKVVLFLTAVTVTAVLCVVADAQRGRGTFAYRTIDVPGATATTPTDVNNRGDITGFYSDGAIEHAFVLRNGKFVTIDAPDPTVLMTRGWGLSPSGELVGSYRLPGVCPGCPNPSNPLHGFVWGAGGFQVVEVPGASYTTALGINARGDVVGECWADGRAFGFLLRDGVYTRIDMSDPDDDVPWSSIYGINDRGDIAGWYGDSATMVFHGYLLRNGEKTTIDLPGYNNVQAWKVNNSGEVIVRGMEGSHHVSYVWSDGELTQVEFPGATWTRAAGINDRGDVVGQYLASGSWHGFMANKWTVPEG